LRRSIGRRFCRDGTRLAGEVGVSRYGWDS
jgi:hypothetical protein